MSSPTGPYQQMMNERLLATILSYLILVNGACCPNKFRRGAYTYVPR